MNDSSATPQRSLFHYFYRRYVFVSLPLLAVAVLHLSFLIRVKDGSVDSIAALPFRDSSIQKTRKQNSSSWPMQWDRLNASHTTNATWPIPGKKVHIYYIHVGKTGGLTLEYRIPIPITRKQNSFDCVVEQVNQSQPVSVEDALNTCDPQRMQDTAIARQIVASYHLTAPNFSAEQKDWSLKLTNTLLFTIRNPIDRIVSAFHFQYNRGYVMKPKPRAHYRTLDAGAIFYIDCFPNGSLSAAIEALQAESHPQSSQRSEPRPPISDNCRSTAHRAFQGYVAPHILKPSLRKFPHFLFNYQWYLERYMRSYHKPDVIVIRTSHLWNDTTAVDHALGGGAIPFEQPGSAYTHGSERFRHANNRIQRHHYTTLCCLLHRDLQAYQWIVRMAMNLDRHDKEEAIRDLMDTCGVEQQYRTDNGDTDLLAFLWEDWYHATGCTDLLWAPAD